MENIFVQIAKLLAMPKVIANMKKAEKIINDDPEMQMYLNSAQYHMKKFKEKLPDFCKRNPDSHLCKKSGK
jgi:hypothetical protein